MLTQKRGTLCKALLMAEYRLNILNLRARDAEQTVFHPNKLFADDMAGIFAQQIIYIVDRTGGRILDRHNAVTRLAVRNREKDLLKRLIVHPFAFLAEETDDRAFAVCARHTAVRNESGFRLRFQIAPLLLAGQTHDFPKKAHHTLRQFG